MSGVGAVPSAYSIHPAREVPSINGAQMSMEGYHKYYCGYVYARDLRGRGKPPPLRVINQIAA